MVCNRVGKTISRYVCILCMYSMTTFMIFKKIFVDSNINDICMKVNLWKKYEITLVISEEENNLLGDG